MSKTIRTVGITLICLALAAGAVAGGMFLQKNHDEGKVKYPWESAQNVSTSGDGSGKNEGVSKAADLETAFKGSGVTLKALTTGVNSQGYTTKTFGYAVTPANATDQRIVVSMSWVDTSVTDQIAAFFNWSVNSDDKTITIVCKQDFGHQALMTITSQSDSTKYATVTIDCLKKLNGFVNELPFTNVFPQLKDGSVWEDANFSSGYQTDVERIADRTHKLTDPATSVLLPAELASGYSSTYSKDRDFTFAMSISATTTSWTLDIGRDDVAAHPETEISHANPYARYQRIVDGDGNLSPAEFYSKEVNFGDSFGYGKTGTARQARDAIQASINQLSLDTRNEMYALVNNDQYWRMAVKAGANLTVTCNETGDSKTYPITVFYVDSVFLYSFLEPVTSIVPEVTGIEF